MPGILSLLLSASAVSCRFPPLRRDEEQVAHVELRRLHFAHRICRHRRDFSESDVDATLGEVAVTLPQMLTVIATAAVTAPIFDFSRLFRRREEKGVILQRPKAKLEIRFSNERQFMIAVLLLEVIVLASSLLWRCRRRWRSRCEFLGERWSNGHALEAITQAAVRREEEGLVPASRPHRHRGLRVTVVTTDGGGFMPDFPFSPRRDQVVQLCDQLQISLATRQPRYDVRLAPANFHRNRLHRFRVGKFPQESV